jgi:site-specific recombinase XerD
MGARGGSLLSATKKDLKEYLSDNSHVNSDASYNVVCCSFRCFFGWGYQKGLIEENPANGLRSKRRPTDRSFDFESVAREVSMVINSIPTDGHIGRRDRVMLELMLELGLSCSGVASLRVDQFSRDGFVTFRHNSSSLIEYKIPDELSKRVLDYIDFDQKMFVLYPEDLRVLFPSKWGGPLVRQSIWKMIVNRSRAIGIDISPKKIRLATIARLKFDGRTADEVAQRVSMSPDRVRYVMSKLVIGKAETSADSAVAV